MALHKRIILAVVNATDVFISANYGRVICDKIDPEYDDKDDDEVCFAIETGNAIQIRSDTIKIVTINSLPAYCILPTQLINQSITYLLNKPKSKLLRAARKRTCAPVALLWLH